MTEISAPLVPLALMGTSFEFCSEETIMMEMWNLPQLYYSFYLFMYFLLLFIDFYSLFS